MSGSIHINLRPHSKIYINGAVIRADRRVQLELLNEATFLLDTHIMQLEETTTPLRQLYFVLQAALMSPTNKQSTVALFNSLMQATLSSVTKERMNSSLAEVGDLVGKDKIFEALKLLRMLFPIEAKIAASHACVREGEPAPVLAAAGG